MDVTYDTKIYIKINFFFKTGRCLGKISMWLEKNEKFCWLFKFHIFTVLKVEQNLLYIKYSNIQEKGLVAVKLTSNYFLLSIKLSIDTANTIFNIEDQSWAFTFFVV